MLDEKLINKYLKRDFGYQEGGANFRLVRTLNETEVRKSTFTDVTREGIYIRTVTEFRRAPKYNYLGPKPYWSLERLFHVDGTTREILAADWTYEPIFIFAHPETQEELPVSRDIIYALVNVCLYMPKRRAKTQAEYDAEEEAKFEKQSETILQYLENEVPSMALQLKHGSGIVVPETYGDSNNRIVSPTAD